MSNVRPASASAKINFRNKENLKPAKLSMSVSLHEILFHKMFGEPYWPVEIIGFTAEG